MRLPHLPLHEAEKLDVTSDRLPGSNRTHDEDRVGTAELKGLVLGRDFATGLVGADVRALGDEPGTASHR